MRRLVVATAALLTTTLGVLDARGDGTCTSTPSSAAPKTWGVSDSGTIGESQDESPVGRARDLLARARLLDEAATADERTATENAARLPALRSSAKAARDRAERATGDDRESLVSRAEELEADVAVSEAEITVKRRSATDNRHVARELRARALRLVREAPVEAPSTGSPCDPPFRFTSDGRKLYRIECLK